jgi:type IV secretory pathway VirB2 component (pilin)
MIIAAVIQQASLSGPPPASVITSAVNWVIDLLSGPLATAVAVIAIAWVGLSMLSGRMEIRRGLSVVFGCFLLFGARGIADGLRSFAIGENRQVVAAGSPPPIYRNPPPFTNNTNAFDPYAGAAVQAEP